MESIFSRALPTPAPTLFDRLGPELEHLQKVTSVRYGTMAHKQSYGWAAAIAICSLLALYFMDPFIYAMHKYEAMQAYVYLHNHDSKSYTDALAATRMFSQDELDALNRQKATSADSNMSPREAEDKAATVVAYMKSVRDLHLGRYEGLDPIGKLRYLLFVRTGLIPPTEWSGLNPSVE